MRAALAVLAAALSIFWSVADAQQSTDIPAPSSGGVAPAPELWTMPADGPVHEGSGMRCLTQVSGFDRMQFSGATDSNILGSCVYVDDRGAGDAGIRVRRYMAGIGASRTEIENDRMLMEPNPNTGAPLFTVRMDPATTRDGKMGGRLSITKVRNGYLIDCFADAETLQAASAKVALICSN